MKKQGTSFLQRFILLLVVILLVPVLGHSEEQKTDYMAMQRSNLVKELNLSPDKAKEFLAVGDKYHQSREEIIAKIKKGEDDLEAALAVSQPDDNKISQIVTALVADHDQLFATFRTQRNEEMALLTPVQRGKFLLALKKWHEEVGQTEKK